MSEEAKIAKYHEAFELFRQFATNFWQFPSFLLVLASGLVIASYSNISSALVRAVVLGFGAGFTFFSLISISRIQYLRGITSELIGRIEDDLGITPLGAETTDRSTRPANLLEKMDLYKYFIYLTELLFIVLFGLSMYNLYLAY